MISEWATFLIKDADISFVSGANLSTIIISLAAIETCLRSEADCERMTFAELINRASIDEQLRAELHTLRKYRNKWVHVSSPWSDEPLYESEIEETANRCITALRRIIYANPLV